jgi:hypothetical protein
MALPEGHEQAAPRVIDAEAIRTAGKVVPPPRLDAGADCEHEQGVAAGVGHVAPCPAGGPIHAGDVRRPDAGRRAADAPAARVVQLEDALASQEDDAAACGERGGLARGADGRWQLVHGSRATGRHAREDQGGERKACA